MRITSLADGGVTTFSCPLAGQNAITSNSASLIDTNRVAVTSCSFICRQANISDAPTITIQFTLAPIANNQEVQNIGTIPFETSVTLRNR